LGDAELRVMDVLWRDGEQSAKRVVDILKHQIGWNKNTTYTLIRRCVEKGAVARQEPGFIVRALVAREEVQRREMKEFVDKLFNGSVSKLFAALVDHQKLSEDEIEELKRIVERMK